MTTWADLSVFFLIDNNLTICQIIVHLVQWLLSTWHYHYLISQHIITYSSQLSSGAGVLSRSLLCYCQTLESSKVHVTSKMILKDILGICKHWFDNFTHLKSFRRKNVKICNHSIKFQHIRKVGVVNWHKWSSLMCQMTTIFIIFVHFIPHFFAKLNTYWRNQGFVSVSRLRLSILCDILNHGWPLSWSGFLLNIVYSFGLGHDMILKSDLVSVSPNIILKSFYWSCI